jgi:uncharacterized protein (TIGR03083 family)
MTPTTPRRPTLDRRVAMQLARTEYDRCLAQFRALGAPDWGRPTECSGWTVRDMAAHMLGMVEMAASFRESRRQQRQATAAGGVFIDALTGLQVVERADWPPERIVERFAARRAAAVRGRRMTPGFIRSRSMELSQEFNGEPDDWSIGYLIDVILTRDPWTHRGDIARATGQPAELTPDHDGVIIADVVTEWASRHDKPYRLRLTGPVGGAWSRGIGGEELELDAVEFCRLVSGRGTAEQRSGLLGVEVPF